MPDILLLDEPTNHLDAESVAWLQKFLHDFPNGSAILDRGFLDEGRLDTRIDRGAVSL